MKDSFTIDELREFFESHVVNSDKHGSGYYTTIDGEIHSTDVGYFIECMPYFLQDLQTKLDEINKPEIERNKKMCSYKTPIEALNHLWHHVKWKHSITLTVYKFPDNGDGVVYNYYGNIGPLLPDTGDKFDISHPEADWTHSESYHIQYDEENNNVIFFVNIGEYNKLSNK